MFGVAKRLFGVDIEPADGQAPVWNKDVSFFKVVKDGKAKAYFYLDPYSRPAEKRGGAWMNGVTSQSKLFAPPGEKVRLPVAHMVCNQVGRGFALGVWKSELSCACLLQLPAEQDRERQATSTW